MLSDSREIKAMQAEAGEQATAVGAVIGGANPSDVERMLARQQSKAGEKLAKVQALEQDLSLYTKSRDAAIKAQQQEEKN